MIRGALLQQLGNGRAEAEIKSLAAGLGRRGVACRYFLEKEMQRGRVSLDRSTLVAGHIPLVLAALRRLGIDPPEPNDYPACLRPWLRRRIWESSVTNVVATLQEGASRPFFAKPIGRHKRFRGHVFSSWDDLRMLGGASDHLRVVCSEVVEWLSEYRAYVVRGKIVGVKHYLGDAGVSVDMGEVEQAVAAFEASGEATAGYGIDFGVLTNGKTALIEVNDGYSLGSYGLDDDAYTDLIKARWCELVGLDG